MLRDGLRTEIDTKVVRLLQKGTYDLKRHNVETNALRELANLYSWWLEHPALRKELLLVEKEEGIQGIKRRARCGRKAIEDAWKFLKKETGRDIEGKLSHEVIIETGRIINPDVQGYRGSRVTLGFPRYTPPNPIRVPDKVEELLAYLRAHKEDMHAIERAAYLHLALAGIQPFRDGNKRTARLMQDKLLADHSYPPAVIHPGERRIYLDVLEGGLADWQDGKVDGVSRFEDFVASKVNMALDDMLGDLRVNCRR